MRLATWNVNSIRVRLPQLLAWLDRRRPDVVCLQETKVTDAGFPRDALLEAGYQALFSGQKGYNGVAILSKRPAEAAGTGIPGFPDPQKRVLAATVDGVRVVCVYVPNGESVDSDKYRYKLEWLAALTAWLKEELIRHPRLAVAGDYNIAPEEADVYDAASWQGRVLFSPPERVAFRALLSLGLADGFRLFPQPPASFTWWDYRMAAFRRNRGLRIDHILLSPRLAAGCTACVVERELRGLERPSDHAPLLAEVEAGGPLQG